MRHVKNQMADFKNLIPYLETSFCADQKSYKNHDDPKHLSTVIAIESYKKWAILNLLISNASFPFVASLKGCNPLSMQRITMVLI